MRAKDTRSQKTSSLAYVSPQKLKSGIRATLELITDFLPNEAPTPVAPSSPVHREKRMWRLLTAMFVQRGVAAKQGQGAKLSFSGKLYAKDSLLTGNYRSIARLASTTQPQKGTKRLLLLGASLYKHSCLKGTLSPASRVTTLPITFLPCTNIGVNFGHFYPWGGQQSEGSR